MLQVSEPEERKQGSIDPSTRRGTRTRFIAIPLIIYAVSRLIGAVFLTIGAGRQAEIANQPTHYVLDTIPASPGYWGVMANWDGQWYKTIAIDGYPTELPTASGHVIQNAWAFYPLFPTLSRAVMWSTGMSFEVAGGLLSLVCGGAAVVLLYGLLRRRMSTFASAATLAALCSYPTAPVLQVAYSESLTLLVLVSIMLALRSRRYGVFMGLVILLSLSRPIALPLALVAAAHWAGRWRSEGYPGTLTGWVKPVPTIAFTAASTFLWPVIAWLSTGERRAFFLTQEAWRLSLHDSFLSASVLGQAVESWPVFALALLPPAIFLYLALRPAARHRWGLELRAWVVVYPAYIMLATQPTFSVVRYMMLALVPWWPFPEAGEREAQNRVARLIQWTVLVMVLSIGFTAQYYWVTRVFTIDVSPAHQGFP